MGNETIVQKTILLNWKLVDWKRIFFWFSFRVKWGEKPLPAPSCQNFYFHNFLEIVFTQNETFQLCWLLKHLSTQEPNNGATMLHSACSWDSCCSSHGYNWKSLMQECAFVTLKILFNQRFKSSCTWLKHWKEFPFSCKRKQLNYVLWVVEMLTQFEFSQSIFQVSFYCWNS